MYMYVYANIDIIHIRINSVNILTLGEFHIYAYTPPED